MNTIRDYRAFYANFVVKSADSSNERLISAFSSVERERFVGAGPWLIRVNSEYIQTPTDDPKFLYQDFLVGLASDRGINNGQPSLHARCLAACKPNMGESVIHIGTGSGYYTAILAMLVGDTGHVVGYEIEPDLALQARENLRHLPNVRIAGASANDSALDSTDVIYVSAGATHPVASWLDALNVGGRLLFPLTPNEGYGCMLLVTRRGPDSFAASIAGRVKFIPCIGARDDVASAALTTALGPQSFEAVKSLRRGTEPDDSAWCVGSDWWLSTAEPS